MQTILPKAIHRKAICRKAIRRRRRVIQNLTPSPMPKPIQLALACPIQLALACLILTYLQ